MSIKPIYLDYNSTTPVDPRVLDYMLPFFSENYGNASSRQHVFGWIASSAVENARETVAQLVHAEKDEIYFTSGATESINLALRGVFKRYSAKGKHIITCSTEHPAVLDTCKDLEFLGAEITYLPVNDSGCIDLNQLQKDIRTDTILVSLMAANNETGVLHPLKEISELCHKTGALFFSDATQAAGKIEINVIESGIDLLAISAHKFYGPKGCGALYVRRKNPRVSIGPEITGGGQEKNLRSGTLNVPGIAGMGKAAELVINDLLSDSNRLMILRDNFERDLSLSIDGILINGDINARLPNVSNIFFPRVRAADLMTRCPNIAMAAGSACASANPEPSHVLKAMHKSLGHAGSSLRISLGRFTSQEEMKVATEQLISAYRGLIGQS